MTQDFGRLLRVTATTFLVAAGAALMTGCKGNTTAADSGGSTTLGPPPTVHAQAVSTNPAMADPLTDPVWQKASWSTLGPAANTIRTTPTTLAATLYDSANLYVAVICNKSNSQGDKVSIFLDTTASGKESIEISTDATGNLQSIWRRASAAPQPHEDGTPNFSFPMSSKPWPSTGLAVKLGAGENRGVSVWTAVVTIPMKSLPQPLRATAAAGGHWKMNVLREVTNPSSTVASGFETLQSNLSPVQKGAQPVAPYRMAELLLLAPGETTGNSSSISRTGNDL